MIVIADFLREFVKLVFETAPYLLVGFFVAGLLKVFVSQRLIRGHLGRNTFGSVFKAALYGIPIPLCSCSVIPSATSLRKGGASKGATASFLISTPETGVDSISVTYALLDPLMTIVRPVVALFSALLTGMMVNLMVRRGWDSTGVDESVEGETSCEKRDCCMEEGHHSHAEEAEAKGPLSQRLRAASHYAFGPLLDDLTLWLLLGFAISAAISALTPDSFFVETVPGGLPAMLMMLVIATPFYICATGSTPIAAALIAKGLDPGAALVFLLVGPATNATTMLVVSRLLGRRALGAYLFGISAVALLAGGFVSRVYADSGLDLAALVSEGLAEQPGWLPTATGLLFLWLMYRSARRTSLCGPWVGRFVLAAGLAFYATTCFTLLTVGEKAWVMRFGGVVRSLDEPGLYVHWPYPIERTEVVYPERVRSFAVGFSEEEEEVPTAFTDRQLDDAAEAMTGDGALIRVTYAVHYSWADPYAVRFKVDDPDALTRAFALSAIRQVAARRNSAALLVDDRDQIASLTAKRLQDDLDSIQCGLHVESVNVRDVHAPPDVHYAYRDVASALEDKERSSHDAARDRADAVARATAKAYRAEQDALSSRDSAIQAARGEANRFLANRAAYSEHLLVSQQRMRLEALEKALTGTRLFVLLGANIRLSMMNVDEERFFGIEALLDAGRQDSGRTGKDFFDKGR